MVLNYKVSEKIIQKEEYNQDFIKNLKGLEIKVDLGNGKRFQSKVKTFLYPNFLLLVESLPIDLITNNFVIYQNKKSQE